MDPTNQTVPEQASKGSDILGVLSIIAPFVGVALLGIILGIIGLKKAKREGRSATLSRIGVILNSIVLCIALVGILLAFLAVPALQRNSRNTARKSDLTVIAAELENYYANNQSYPADLNELGMHNIHLSDSSNNAYTYKPTPADCQKCTGYHLEANIEPAGSPPYTLDGGR